MFEIFEDVLDGQTLILRVHDPTLLDVHRDADHDAEHAETQADGVHDVFAIYAGFEFAYLP